MEYHRTSRSTTPSSPNLWTSSGNGAKWTPSDLSTVYRKTRWRETTSPGHTCHTSEMAKREASPARLEEWHDTPRCHHRNIFPNQFLLFLHPWIRFELGFDEWSHDHRNLKMLKSFLKSEQTKHTSEHPEIEPEKHRSSINNADVSSELNDLNQHSQWDISHLWWILKLHAQRS